MASGSSSSGGLEGIATQVKAVKGPPPVHLWNPPFCGDLDMRIAADGTWFYMKTPIGRPALVKLFSSVLKRENGRYFLVTPVEKVGITVDDAPFAAVEMRVSGSGRARGIALRTQTEEWVEVGPDHSLRFEKEAGTDGLKPYIHVRRDLWARVSRALFQDLAALGEIASVEDSAGDRRDWFGLYAAGTFYPMVPAAEIEGLM
ncbi:DUF1285 domain-containing protein [Phreatobacter sp. AB_2022a]|uniref:DUF1285 domain-containing protein n=1 Tax=Phreatobacter sp. AB_2022a TaxID=3003134 RepID=UPI0022873D7D|nr:DUF1285 domain-containing protein [Phreatobacter sp. AB_2022a]MCZ0737786.1 DUF1285 domain-containing protein [Phreatobacter sp. AB_2022a]